LGLPAGFGLGANISARLVDRLGVPRQAALGFSLVGASCVWLARSPSHGSLPPSIIVGMFGVGLGLGITVLVLITTVTSGVETSDQGALAGVYGMSQQLGGAIGLAVLASIAASGGTAGSGGHTTRSILQQAHSIRSAYALTAAIAVTTAVFARLALPSRNRFTEQRSRVTPSHEHSPF
jgi:MFS family permease